MVSSAAKGTPNHTIMHSDLADWQQSWLVNVLGPLELFRTAVPHLAVGGRRCDRGRVGAWRCARSTPARARTRRRRRALTIAAQTLAREVGVDGIRVNVVVPGFVPGPNTETMFARHGRAAGHDARSGAGADRGRAPRCADSPTPDDIADAIVFLASDRARSITGQTLDVNGGRWMA